MVNMDTGFADQVVTSSNPALGRISALNLSMVCSVESVSAPLDKVISETM